MDVNSLFSLGNTVSVMKVSIENKFIVNKRFFFSSIGTMDSLIFIYVFDLKSITRMVRVYIYILKSVLFHL